MSVNWCFVNIVLKSKEKYELIFWSQVHFNLSPPEIMLIKVLDT